MKKITLGVAVALTLSANAFADEVINKQIVSTQVTFGQPAPFSAKIVPKPGLEAGKTANNTVIATVSVTGAGEGWALSYDPNDSSANAPDGGWTMKSKSDPTKTVKVAASNDGRSNWREIDNVVWNIYPADKSASIVIKGDQTISAADDYDLAVNVAKYVP